MFESLALEDPRNTRRRWTTAASLALEAVALGVLVLAPLGYTEAISLKVGEPLVAPSGMRSITRLADKRPPNEPNAPPPLIREGRLTYGGAIPKTRGTIIDQSSDLIGIEDPDAVLNGVGPYVSNNSINNLIKSPASASRVELAVKAPTVIRRSHLDPGMLIKQVQPTYPRPAVAARIEGTVLLAAVVDMQGRITQLHALSGHPLLVPAAIEAVKQWRYRPYILNGNPVEVETQVSVIFTLQQ